MAGRRKFQGAPNDPSLNADFWLQFSEVAEPTVRNKLVYLAMHEVGKTGPSAFNGVRICERLAVSASLVNHYFGGRDGLVAEATATAYRSYVIGLRNAAASASNAEDALRAWMHAQIAWAQANPGLSEILNYSSAHGEVSRLIHRDYQREITQYFEFNMFVVFQLVRAIHEAVPYTLPETPDDVDRASALEQGRIVTLASSVAWSTLGAAVWASGQHTPSAETPESRALYEQVLEAHIERVLSSVR